MVVVVVVVVTTPVMMVSMRHTPHLGKALSLSLGQRLFVCGPLGRCLVRSSRGWFDWCMVVRESVNHPLFNYVSMYNQESSAEEYILKKQGENTTGKQVRKLF